MIERVRPSRETYHEKKHGKVKNGLKWWMSSSKQVPSKWIHEIRHQIIYEEHM
jgi:hypothetical protein